MRKRIFLMAGGLLVIGTLTRMRREAAEPGYWPLPAFQATAIADASVSPITLTDLAGKPWVANFVFTHCGGPCPILSEKMSKLQTALPSTVRLLTFTVDPDRDTAPVLTRYGRSYGADASRWLFVRMEKDKLFKLMYEGFRLPMAVDQKAPSGFRVTHSTRFVLVDGRGRVRHFYDVDEENWIERLQKDAAALVKESV